MHWKLYKQYGDMIKVKLPFQPPGLILYNPKYVQEMHAKASDGNKINSPGFDPFYVYRNKIRKDLFQSGIKSVFCITFWLRKHYFSFLFSQLGC